jgi:aryl-alcohol dehydrogenase-like predicted oxidoreductase
VSYAARFSRSLPGHFRPLLEWVVSSIGIGTYLGENDGTTDEAYRDTVRAAVLTGINLIDTAVNYRLQRSERSIGNAIAELVSAGQARREELIIATKGGYITFDGEVPANPRDYFKKKFIDPGVIQPADLVEGSHCMAPRYLEMMLEQSLQNLGLETVDIYYLHNPETQLPAVGREEFRRRMQTAFEFLESKVGEKKISVYGAATWNGFRTDPAAEDYLSLQELVHIAEQVGGPRHHFRVIQLPYNLAMAEALTRSNQALRKGQGSILDAAKEMGVAVCASASILQGKLARGLPSIVGDAMRGLRTDAQRSIQFVRSTPGITTALVGMKSVEHLRENMESATHQPAPLDAFMKLFERPKNQQ